MLHVHCIHPDRPPDLNVPERRGLDAGVDELIWYDIESPTPAELDALESRWQFHPLATEDCRRPQRRSRYERYPNHSFLVLQTLDPSTAEDPLDSHTVAIFIRPKLLVTVRPPGTPDFARVWRMLKEAPPSNCRAEALAHMILRTAVEEFDPVLDEYETAIDALAARAGHADEPTLLDDLIALRRDLLQVRRMMQSYQEVARRLLDAESVPTESALYLRDVRDHAVAITEICGVLIEIGNGAVEVHANAANERLNLVMKRLAAISGALVPGTIISGAFGMNFTTIPGSSHAWGFYAVLGSILVLSLAILGAMRARKWI